MSEQSECYLCDGDKVLPVLNESFKMAEEEPCPACALPSWESGDEAGERRQTKLDMAYLASY
jgi:hypothetical protein